jgi:hypothetical protein
LLVVARAGRGNITVRISISAARPLTEPDRYDLGAGDRRWLCGHDPGESLGTALCIRITQHFVSHLPLPVRKGLSPVRLRRVRDYIEAHLDDDLSLTVLADISCLSPCHLVQAGDRD